MIVRLLAAVLFAWTVAALTYPDFTRITLLSPSPSPRRRHPAG